jgi:hypothetical protein
LRWTCKGSSCAGESYGYRGNTEWRGSKWCTNIGGTVDDFRGRFCYEPSKSCSSKISPLFKFPFKLIGSFQAEAYITQWR